MNGPAAAPTVEMSVLVAPPPVQPAPRTGISPLSARNGSAGTAVAPVPAPERVPAPQHQGTRPEPVLSSRFDYISFEDEMLGTKPTRTRRIVQGGILAALVAAAASVMVLVPNGEDGASVAADGELATRVATEAEPVATAEMLTDGAGSEVDGSLQTLASRGLLSGDRSEQSAVGIPGDSGDGFAVEVAAAVGAVEIAESPTTTAWVEPTLPPESNWVDGGNGVAVPDLLLRIRFCESTNNYQATNPRSTASGAYQFLNKSWDWYGHAARTGLARAHLATPAQQDESALLTLQAEGTGPWSESRPCWANPDIDPRYATAKPPAPAPAPTTTAPPGSTSTDTTDGSTSTETTDPSTTVTTDPSTTETTDGSTSTETSEPTTTSTTAPPSSSTSAGG